MYGLVFLDDLDGKDNMVVGKEQLITLNGKPFESIVWLMPSVQLTQNKVLIMTDIHYPAPMLIIEKNTPETSYLLFTKGRIN